MDNATEVSNDGDGSSDNLTDIQEIVGTTADDTIYGSATSEVLIGNNNSDTLMGRGGNDTIYGGLENRSDDSTSDTVSYEYLTNGSDRVIVDLSTDAGTATVIVGDTDTLYDVENIVGGAGNDTITGR